LFACAFFRHAAVAKPELIISLVERVMECVSEVNSTCKVALTSERNEVDIQRVKFMVATNMPLP